ncbi:MAG: NfeD family protein, partial [Verrucomicrobiota bacterium]
FITLAADVAAMAPNTSIGAAHPVMIGGGGQGESKPDEVMKQKLENFATSYIEAIATKRNRNVEWAKSAVRESASITSEKALELKVIEIIAKDSSDLLQQLDGRETDHGVLRTAGATIRPNPMLLREQIFQVLGRPEVMFILMLVAVYGLIGELSNPGAILPGVVGLIALIVSLYLSTILPINIAGFALILLAVALFIADAFVSAHGILTIGGVVSFFLGALMLFETAEPLYRLSLGLIIPATVLTALFFLFVAGAGLRAQLWPVKVGRETIVGKEVRTVTKIDATSGKVLFEGEYWNAISDTPIESGAFVEIIGRTGLTLKVKPKTPTPT